MDKDKLISELQLLTQNMMERLYQAEFEEFESFVEERQKLIDNIIRQFSSIPASGPQKIEIERILHRDLEITARMNELRQEARDWLQKRNQAKAQRNAYEAAYTPDSILMDRKK
ncbi:flagellar protein FliT [Paenibacillus ihuae]|uniref:flagellar protein FliT n=1 Tax=Paenibacillus ihuae TaxID=1232431 RepID=UPI0006D52F6B|nr:flagellar protein FliT [Paenibacillus ihuae]